VNQELPYYAHETSCIDTPCVIGKGTKVWHFSHIMQGSTIGERCNIGQNVVISPGCRIGNNVKIQNNVSVYSGVILEDDVFCGPSAVFTNIINPRSHIPRKDQYQETLVKQGASIGANATVVCGTTLGAYCFIGAGAVVTRDVPDYALVYGNPAKLHGWVCNCGIKLQFTAQKNSLSAATCPACAQQYSRNGLRVSPLQTSSEERTKIHDCSSAS